MLLPLPQGCLFFRIRKLIRTQESRRMPFILCSISVFGRRADAICRRQKLCCGPTPEEPPKALQTSECDELLDLARTSCMILVQRQPGKFILRSILEIFVCVSLSKAAFLELQLSVNRLSVKNLWK